MDDFYKVAIIATFLALAFAMAAFFNSNRKTKALPSPPTPSPNEPFFMKAVESSGKMSFDNITATSSTAATPEPVFKQMTTSGKPESRRIYAGDEYVWE